MALKDVLQQFLNDEQWEVEITYDDSDDTYSITADYEIEDQRHTVLLTTSEEPPNIQIFMSCPIKIPKTRAEEAALVLNHLNLGMRFGTFICDAGIIHFRYVIPVDGTTAAPEQFAWLLNTAADAFFDTRVESIAAVAFTKRSAADIIEAFENAMNISDENAMNISDEVSNVLPFPAIPRKPSCA